MGLLLALHKVHLIGCKNIIIKGDSSLVIKQLEEEYKVKSNNLISLHKQVKNMLSLFDNYQLQHISRDLNLIADSQANEAIDNHT